jgi:hypothetical protein
MSTCPDGRDLGLCPYLYLYLCLCLYPCPGLCRDRDLFHGDRRLEKISFLRFLDDKV